MSNQNITPKNPNCNFDCKTCPEEDCKRRLEPYQLTGNTLKIYCNLATGSGNCKDCYNPCDCAY